MRRVCISFGMSVPEVLSPCSSLALPAPPTFPSTTYLHRALPAFPWLARLAATAHRRRSCSQGRKWAEHSATLIPGILDMYRSISPPHTHLPLTHRPFWMHRFDPLRLSLGEVCWVLDELLIGNERWLSPSRVSPSLSIWQDLRRVGCTVC